MGARSTTTAVEIFGSVYYVRGSDNDGDSLRELASVVDSKMREVAAQVATVDTAKLAVLTALNLADELSRCQKIQEGERDKVREKVRQLTQELQQALRD
ncbi:MAG: cell division protein ZapA [Acidobacteria bacterium]|nr:cell division protein ZapA [Acidobacteriota bacterium]